ncbi:T9SS type A sorting domain-containing protein [Winogradskyella ursingii]|uniref:T9SS type A sorting domain-containing protein n=1 Tax=Winogradskyella ursingii TaxID=2686079 RepID=UPI0015C708AE|nr:T9SS type A sorting domain-containing protein [Winogradskyella ursingii]
MKKKYLLFLAFCITIIGFGQTIIYDADFSNNGDGFADHTTASPPAVGPISIGPFGSIQNSWNLSYDTAPITDGTANSFKVVSGELQSDDWGGQGIFMSQSIDVSGSTTINITASSTNAGAIEGNFIYFYILDGDARVETNVGATTTGQSINYSVLNLDVSANNSLVVGFEFDEDGLNQGYSTSEFQVEDVFNGLVFYNNNWTPSPPDITTGTLDAKILNGEYIVTSNANLNDMFVTPGAGVNVPTGFSLVTNSINLQSYSQSYSSIIADGSVTGTLIYSRFTNIMSSAPSEGNDLISAPLAGITWQEFITTGLNTTVMAQNFLGVTTDYAFAPFDKTTGDFENYNSSTLGETLESGKGYRAATIEGANLLFQGSLPTTPVSIPITVSGPQFMEWNLIGNPFPSYLKLSEFLNTSNKSVLDDVREAVYGYDGTDYQVYNQAFSDMNPTFLIAPAQGFFVAAAAGGGSINFTDIMRSSGNTDDFITGRSNNVNISNLKLSIATSSKSFSTDFYFTENATRGLNPGYDSAVFGDIAPTFSIYSHLVENNVGLPFAVQSLGDTDINDTTIPLGVNANQGEQITFTIDYTDLPSEVEVYLEDNVANTVTLLNSGDYVFTPNSDLNGTGRFFLRFTNSVLSAPENDFNSLSIYTDQPSRTIVIDGQLSEETVANVYDIQGRLVTTKILEVNTISQSFDVSSISTGIYVVKLSSNSHSKTQKIILK